MIYRGLRRSDGVAVVTVDGKQLPLRLDLANHSPTGFEWGYGGSGPAQLALALLAYELQNDEWAVHRYQAFRRLVARFDRDKPWSLTSEELRAALLEVESEIRHAHKIREGG